MAQSGSAHDWGSCGRWFKSSHPDIKPLILSEVFLLSHKRELPENLIRFKLELQKRINLSITFNSKIRMEAGVQPGVAVLLLMKAIHQRHLKKPRYGQLRSMDVYPQRENDLR